MGGTGRFRDAAARRRGQAMVESVIVLLVLCLLLFGFLQAAISMGGREILHHAAARAGCARSVGFNSWMAEKSARVAAIPVSGRFLAEEVGWSPADGAVADFELSRIPEYLASENHARADYVLDYDEWEKGTLSFGDRSSALGNGVLHFTAGHHAPLVMPFSPIAFPWAERDGDGVPRIDMSADAVAVEHSGFYLK